MKLVWGKIANNIAMSVMPRAELTPEEQAEKKGDVMVDLSRSKNGGCIYPLNNLAGHDYHAPRWAVDGSAPSNSSAASMTAQLYMDRVKADIEAQGVTVTEVEFKELLIPVAAPSPYGGEEGPPPMSAVDWTKYVGEKPVEEEEEGDD